MSAQEDRRDQRPSSPDALSPTSSSFPTSPTSPHYPHSHGSDGSPSRPPSFAYPELADLPDVPGLAVSPTQNERVEVEQDIYRNPSPPPGPYATGEAHPLPQTPHTPGHWWEQGRRLHYADEEQALQHQHQRDDRDREREGDRPVERHDMHLTPHTLVGGHTPPTLGGISPLTLKGSDSLPHGQQQPPTIHITPAAAFPPYQQPFPSTPSRVNPLRRRNTLASTISGTTGSSSSSSSSGWGPIGGLANLVERAIAKWARHAHDRSESSDASSSRSSLISYPTYRAPPRTERLFQLLLPEDGVGLSPPHGEGVQPDPDTRGEGGAEREKERFVRTEDLSAVLARLEPELQRRYRHRRHHRRNAPSGSASAGQDVQAGAPGQDGERRRRRRRDKSRLREETGEGSGTSTPDALVFSGSGKGKNPAPISTTTGGAPGQGTITPNSGSSTPNYQPQAHSPTAGAMNYVTPAALLRADLGSRAGSGVNLSLLNTLHQNLAAAASASASGAGSGGASGSSTQVGSPVSPQGPFSGPGHGHMVGQVHSALGGHPMHPPTLAVPPSGAQASTPHSPLPRAGKERSAWWLDVASPTPSDMRALGKVLHLHPLTLEDVLFQDPREKLDLYPRLGYYFITFSAIPSREEAPGMPYSRTLDPDTFSIASNASSATGTGRWEGVDMGDLGPSKVEGVQMYMVVFADGIVTFHFHDFEQHIRRVRDRALKLEKMFPILADWIAHGLVDSIVDAYLPIIKRLERETDRLASMIQSFSFHKGEPRFHAPTASKSPLLHNPDGAAIKKDDDLFTRGFGNTGEEGVFGATVFDSSREKSQARRRVSTGSPGSSSRDRKQNEEIEMEEKTNRQIDRHVEQKLAREQEVEKEAEMAHTHWDGPIKPPKRRFAYLRDVYSVLVRLVPHRGLQRVMSIEPQRPKPPHPRVVTLYRIASARRMVTSITRLLVHKPVVLSSLRRRFAGVKGIKGDVGVYLDDVEDHVIGMQQALAYCDGTLSQLHPGYLSQLKVAFENAKNGMDKRLLFLSLISISILTIQVWIGMFSMNVTVPNNFADGGYEIFGFVFVGMVVLLCFVMGIVRFWWVTSRKRFKERRRNR